MSFAKLQIARPTRACSCVPATWFDKIGYYNMAPRLEYQGFSFDRPPNRNWYFLQSEQSYTNVTLRRGFWNPSKAHTFHASVSLGGMEREPDSTQSMQLLARPRRRTANLR